MLCAGVLSLLAPQLLGDIVLSEFVASNQGGLSDGWGDTPDWIELQNTGSTPVDLAGWHLTDNPDRPTQWTFPAETLEPSGFLIVFASERNRRDPAGHLHTNFKLSTEGEPVLLLQPDGRTVASRLNQPARPQLSNIAFGRTGAGASETLLRDDAPLRTFVPADADLGLQWTLPGFVDGSWLLGHSPVGFEDTPENYAALIQTDVTGIMRGRNTTCYVRQEFTVGDPLDYTDWRLQVQYDDGFLAWINGEPVGGRNAPASPTWNAVATQNHPDTEALIPDELPIPASSIRAGSNLLAMQGMNVSFGSSDFLLRATVHARPVTAGEPTQGYLTQPTPGRANAGGRGSLGPLIDAVRQEPRIPRASEALLVTARIVPAFAAVQHVSLTYLVQFGDARTLEMRDDGTGGDVRAGDDTFAATIPPGTAGAGQMIRYFITATDRDGSASRLPLNLDPLDSERYLGTVIADPSVESQLPVIQLFVAPSELSRIDGESGGRVNVFFDGEFYDNVLMEVRGNTTAGCNKKSHRVEFPRDHLFRHPGPGRRIRKTSFMADYADPSYLRQHLSFWLAGQAGLHAPLYDPVRLQMNGAFYQLAFHSDVLGEEQLTRFGLDPDGALYKACGVVIPDGSSTGGFQKRTRLTEGTQDYVEFANAIRLGLPAAQRRLHLFDRVDLPQVINYMAVARIVQEEDDVWANMTLYRDSEGDREWRIIPFDMNLSWGQIYGSGTVQSTTDSFKSHPLYGNARCIQAGGPFDAYNRLYDAIIQVPETRQMLLRRMRTLMDRVLQPPGTPADQGLLEQHIRTMTNAFWAEAFLDRKKWGWPVGCGPYGFGANLWLTNGVHALQNQFITPRRRHLFATHSITNTVRAVGISNSQRAGIPLTQAPGIPIQLGEIDFNPVSRNQGEEYIQLINAHADAVDISGWVVSGAVDYTFPGGTVIPADSALYLSPDVAAFRSRTEGPRGGQGLFVHGPYGGQLSARGETVVLSDDAGQVVASRTYGGTPSPAQSGLRITEIHYHPSESAGAANDPEDLEFIELENTGRLPLDLTGVRFTDGIVADLGSTPGGPLAPGETLVVARNAAVLGARLGAGRRIVGDFLGRLDNGGERLRLVDAFNEEIEDFSYDPDWHPSTDGAGFSLERIAPELPPGTSAAWRASRLPGGSPGAGGAVRPRILAVRLAAIGLELDVVVGPDPLQAIEHTDTLEDARWDLFSNPALPTGTGPSSVTLPPVNDGVRFLRLR